MIISNLQINGIGGITSLDIPLHPRMNIICGPNGIGKTTILECVAHLFSHGQSSFLKRNVKFNSGEVRGVVNGTDGQERETKISVEAFEPTAPNNISGDYVSSRHLLSLKTTRTFTYAALSAVSRDAERPDHVTYTEAQSGIALNDTKNWFVNRYLYSAHPGSLSPAQTNNFELAKKCFSQLHPDFSFARVNAATNEIMVNTPTGEIYYEYLSSGFKSCLAIMFGIMKEIEFRFPNTEIENFSGIVLIDEVELHLHPEWQSKIIGVLLEIFPSIQFITTTHSPHVIQNAEPSTIVALERKGSEVIKRELPSAAYGFKGWTVEEVLEDVMGMSDTRTLFFNYLMEEFGSAVERSDVDAAVKAYKQLDELLHPANVMRKIIRLQLSSIGEKID